VLTTEATGERTAARAWMSEVAAVPGVAEVDEG
jgi:hypothetical protein